VNAPAPAPGLPESEPEPEPGVFSTNNANQKPESREY
jgi:hypothetical protein